MDEIFGVLFSDALLVATCFGGAGGTVVESLGAFKQGVLEQRTLPLNTLLYADCFDFVDFVLGGSSASFVFKVLEAEVLLSGCLFCFAGWRELESVVVAVGRGRNVLVAGVLDPSSLTDSVLFVDFCSAPKTSFSLDSCLPSRSCLRPDLCL